jgi:prepilin-type N-terminal cleavage/methylation domain-containing protein
MKRLVPAILRVSHQTSAPRRYCRGVSLTETLVVIVIFTILLAISIAALGRAKKARNHAACAANLRSIGLAFESYATDNADYFPVPSTNAQWEDLLRRYVPRVKFYCPSDEEIFRDTGSSYDWRDTGDPVSTLCGKRTADVTREDLSLAFDTLPGWHDKNTHQVVYTDTSVHLVDQDIFLRGLQAPVISGP